MDLEGMLTTEAERRTEKKIKSACLTACLCEGKPGKKKRTEKGVRRTSTNLSEEVSEWENRPA